MTKLADETLIAHVAFILEAWDMKPPPNDFTGHNYRDIARDIITARRQRDAVPDKFWLWKNFVGGAPEYWAFDNPYPTVDGGDPLTLGQPCGWALFKPSVNGRPSITDEEVKAKIAYQTDAVPGDLVERLKLLYSRTDSMLAEAAAAIQSLTAERDAALAANYKSFTDGMEAAAQICGSLAETTYDDTNAFEVATGCEASIMRVVKQQRAEQPCDLPEGSKP